MLQLAVGSHRFFCSLIAHHVLDIAIVTSPVLAVSHHWIVVLDQVTSHEEIGIAEAAIYSGHLEDVFKDIKDK